MKIYKDLVEAINDLRRRGYIYDYYLNENVIICDTLKQVCVPKEFDIIEIHRFEDMSDVSSESVIYALETTDGKKGILVDAYGTYSNAMSPEMLEKLRYKSI